MSYNEELDSWTLDCMVEGKPVIGLHKGHDIAISGCTTTENSTTRETEASQDDRIILYAYTNHRITCYHA